MQFATQGAYGEPRVFPGVYLRNAVATLHAVIGTVVIWSSALRRSPGHGAVPGRSRTGPGRVLP
jgi:hypothetical protein